ncbi:tetratricopeptide repeat protein [Kitasatospora purpeofusca]|uniref:tetratricopeptide repeat protein n=1 Tax=Kitasatospora purpeofusca TaxID=67352 RepID=UPI0030F2EECA
MSWPHLAEPGRSYLVTVDVEIGGTEPVPDWPYDQEEFAIGCMLAGCPGVEIESLGATAVVLHRFGGTYGPARFVARTADELPVLGAGDEESRLRLTLVTAGGIPFRTIDLPIGLGRTSGDTGRAEEPPSVRLPSCQQRPAEPASPARPNRATAPPEPPGFLSWKAPHEPDFEGDWVGPSILEPAAVDGGFRGSDHDGEPVWAAHPVGSDSGSAYQARSDLTISHHDAEEVPWPATEPRWPVRVGTVPPLASGFQPRAGLREQIDSARARHFTVVLTQVLSGPSGVGKSQLAADYAQRAHSEGVDLLVWVNAAETSQIVAAYAEAARRVGALAGGGQDAESDAAVFLEWLAVTDRSWLVVLDDLVDLEGVLPWWPRPPAGTHGQVLATTRRRDALVSGAGRSVVEVGTYTHEEALAYLHERLATAGAAHYLDAHAEDLVELLGRLPLALAHAAAYMINEAVECAVYLNLFIDRSSQLRTLLPPEADTDGYGRHVTTSLLLALDTADRREPPGLAAPVLRFAAHLDPAGHPLELWSTTAVGDYLTAHRTPPPLGAPESRPVTAAQAIAAVRLLHHYALLTLEARSSHRATHLHALTARAARETTARADTAAIVRAAADALGEIWPEPEHTADPGRAAVLRANAEVLAAHAGDLLWYPGVHPVLFALGSSLTGAGLYTAAVTHWQHLTARAERLLGHDHPDTLTACQHLAMAYGRAGRTSEAITIEERVLVDRERILGDSHPHTLTALHNLAASYWQAGRTSEAITIEERVLVDRERILGDSDPHTLATRHNLARSYWQAGRTAEAIHLLERVLADRERILGDSHPDTLTTRHNLAVSYGHAGRTAEAIHLLERVLADRERILGDSHPDTLTTRNNLARSYGNVGRAEEAIAIEERVLADRERILGDSHPDTLTTRNNLARYYGNVGRAEEAIAIEERVLADRERILGDSHPDTLTTRNNLAVSYGNVGRAEEAIAIEERVLADRARILGDSHPDTLTTRNNLARSYGNVGRAEEAVELLRSVVEQRMQALGPAHPHTAASRADLAMVLAARGRVLLLGDPAGAWREAAEAVLAVGPYLSEHPAVYGPALAEAYHLAADALDSDGQPDAAAEFRRRAADAASSSRWEGGDSTVADGSRP